MNKMFRVFSAFVIVLMITVMLAACSPAESTATEEAGKAESPVTESSNSTAPDTVEEASSGSDASTVDATAFDSFPRPKIKSDGTLTVAYAIKVSAAESQARSFQQAEIECAHRGWTFVPLVIQDSSELRDAILNAINQDVDVLLLGNQESMPSYVDVIEQAREKGIGVYNNDNELVSGVIANSTMPNGISAMELIYAIGNSKGWNGGVGFLEIPTIQVSNERIGPIVSVVSAYSGMTVLERGDLTSDPSGVVVGASNFTATWVQKYGNELTGVVSFFDVGAEAAAEAISAAGDPTGEYTWTAGIDGGTQAWADLRDNTPFQFSYAQPFELYTHKLFELMDQLQVQGLNPGDEGVLISKSGDTMYSTGLVVTRENVPAVGTNIHALYDYYGEDPNDLSAWYNWTDGPGIYKIEGVEEE